MTVEFDWSFRGMDEHNHKIVLGSVLLNAKVEPKMFNHELLRSAVQGQNKSDA